MKHIIVPTDFSILSKEGLKLALLLANHLKAKIDIVHVVKAEENVISLGEEKLMQENIKHLLENIVADTKKSNPDLELKYIIKEGKIHKEVINQADAYRDSIIVTSTHGASGWEEHFTGGNAYRIVASSTRPVFTIRGKEIPKQIKKIVLPLDSTPETREKVPFTASLAALFGAEIRITTVSTSNFKDIQEKLKNYALQVGRYLEKYGVPYQIDHLNGDNITDITIDYAHKEKADLISVMSEQEKSISNILLGSYAHQMINRSPIPVLLFPTKQIGIISESFKTEGIDY